MSARGLALVVAVLTLGALAFVWLRAEPRSSPALALESRVESGVEAAELRAPESPSARAPDVVVEVAPAHDEPAPVVAVPVEGAPDPVQCVLYGSVLDAEGHAIVPWKPYVSLTDASGARVNTTASEDGHYSLAGVAPGPWTLHAGATGYRDQVAPLALTAAEPLRRRDLVMEKAVQLPVRVVTPSGEVLRDALKARGENPWRDGGRPFVVATLEAPGPTIQGALHGGADRIGAGSFWEYGPLAETAGPEYAGVLVLDADLPAFVSLTLGARVLETRRVEPGTQELCFVVDPDALLAQRSSVRVRFVAADTGAPLKAELEVEPMNTFFGASPDGQYPLPPGEHRLSFRAKGYASFTRAITLSAGEQLDLGDVVLPLELTLDGHLLDADGKPVVGRVALGRVDEQGRASFKDDYAYDTDESGYYKVSGLVPGRYLLRTMGDDEIVFPGRKDPPTVWVCGNTPVSTLGGSVTGFDLHLVKAGILVLKGAETLPPGSRCKVLDANGDLLRSQGFYPGFVPRFALPPGAYTLVVCDKDWHELARHALEVGAGVSELDVGR